MKKIFITTFLFLISLGYSYGAFNLTEVLIDGTQEYIEIFYSGSDIYDGKIEIIGVKSKPIQYEIIMHPESYLMVGDSLQQLSNTLCHTINDAKLSLTDSKGVDIQISRSGGSSTVQIDSSLVVSIDNQKRSLTFQQDNFFPIQDTNVQNTTEGWYGSPCLDDKIVGEEGDAGESDEISGTGDSTAVISSGGTALETDPTALGTGSVGSGTDLVENGSGIVLPGDSGDTSVELPDVISSIPSDTLPGPSCNEYALQPGDITIYGISPANGELSDEFLILESTRGYSGTLSIQGGGRGSASIDIRVFLMPEVKYFIIKNERGITSSIPNSIVPSLSLTDGGGSLNIVSNEGVVIDEIYWSGSKKDQILTSSVSSNTTPRQLTSYGTFPHIFSSLSGVVCDLQVFDGNVSLQDTSICALPGVNSWVIGDQTTTSCELGVLYDTTQSSAVVFTKLLGDTVVCMSSLVILPVIVPPPVLGGSGNVLSDTGTTHMYTSGALIISEVSPKDGTFPEYIELTLQEGVEGTFEIQGLGQGGASKEITIGLYTPRIVIITDDLIPSIPITSQIIISSISLTDGGEPLVIRHGGQIIDNLLYDEGIQQDTSRLRTRESGSGSTTLASQTPGFTLSMIEHLLPQQGQEQFSCAIRVQNTSPFTFENKLNLVASVANKDVTNSSKEYACTRTWGDIGNPSGYEESGKCNPGFLSFPSSGIHEIQLRMENSTGKVCNTSTSVNAPTKVTSENKSSSTESKNSYYQTLYQKRKGRFELLQKNIKPYGLKTNSSGSVVTTTQGGVLIESNPLDQVQIVTGVVSIQRLLPNPLGKDTDAEQIVLYNYTKSNLDTTGRRIDTGKKKVVFPIVILKPGVDTIVTGTLGLVNSDRCISIVGEADEVYDIFCYGKATDDKWFEDSNESILSIQSQGGLLLQDMEIAFEDDEVCLMYEGSGVRCKSLPIGNSELKQLKKDVKKVESTQKRYDKELIRRKKYQDQIKDEKKKLAAYKKSTSKKFLTLESKSKKYREDILFQKRLNNIHRGLIQLRYGTLQDDFKPLYVGSSFATQWLTYRASLDMAYSSNTTIEYGPVQFDVVDIDSIHAYLQGESLAMKDNVPSQLSSEIIKGFGERFNGSGYVSCGSTCL